MRGSMFCGLNLVRKASEEQKRYWLPKLLAGEIKMSISMSEPDAGSDIGAMRTTAVRDGNEWVINGQKLWASGAGAKNNVINLYVKTDPKAHYRQGMSLFLVDNDTPGTEMRKLDMLGRRCTGTYELIFNDVRVPADRLVGGENKGWDCVHVGPAGRARRRRRPAMSAPRRPWSISPCNTPRSASSSAGRSAPIRRSRICSPTCRPRSKRRAR